MLEKRKGQGTPNSPTFINQNGGGSFNFGFNFNRKSESFQYSNVQTAIAERNLRHRILSALIFELRSPKFIAGHQMTDFAAIKFYTPIVKNSPYFGLMTDEEIWRRGICEIPGPVLNALICEKLTATFGDLATAGIFRKIKFNDSYYWRIDADEKLSRTGVFEPVRDKSGFIYALRTYRNPDDRRPFILKARRDNA